MMVMFSLRLAGGTLAVALGALLVFGAAGCKSDPYCLNCKVNALDGGSDGPVTELPDLAGVDLTQLPDLTGSPCIPSNNGNEVCDGIDNDCNGFVDDVSAALLAVDPNNCGACGKACNFTAQKQFGACDATNGPPTCVPAGCLPGFTDADGVAANGCEYACNPTNSGTEICDGKDNNCNNQIDEGFDLQNDPTNCGTCGTSCARPNTPGQCVSGLCKITSCNGGFKDLDTNPSNGCEYACPVQPPVAEVCDNQDNDCNGIKDDSPTDVGGTCSNFCGAVAACVASNTCSFPRSTCTNGCCGICTPGMTVCSVGSAVCQAGMRPMLEVCNGADDNCDGQIDEGFNLQTDSLNCGSCNNACNLPHVLTYKCAAATCGIAHSGTVGTTAYKQSGCQPGFSDLDNLPGNGCEHTCEVYPSTVETCDGKDNNCDGVIDETTMTVPSNFCRQTSICSGAQPVCCGANGWLCDYKSVNANIEIQEASPRSCKAVPSGTTRLAGTLVFAETKCDNIDGDCKGTADDSFIQKGKPCTVGVGQCAGTGLFACNGAGTGVQCPALANPAAAAVEECDGKDNNCDGQIDERVANAGFLSGYVDRFVRVGALLWVYEYEASRIDAASGAPGTSSGQRACSRPGVQPWSNITQAQAVAACNAIVLANGTPARLCTGTEWQIACEGPGGPQTNSYSYSSTPTTWAANICNDLSRAGGPAVWNAGFDNGQARKCYTSWIGSFTQPEEKLFDMSGNLMEWTSTSVTIAGNPTTYYRVRGGAYNSPSDGTAPDGDSCQFDFNILPTGFSNSNVGFRCCADSAP